MVQGLSGANMGTISKTIPFSHLLVGQQVPKALTLLPWFLDLPRSNLGFAFKFEYFLVPHYPLSQTGGLPY